MKTILLSSLSLSILLISIHPASDAQWITTNAPDTCNFVSIAALDTNLFAGAYGYGVFRSSDRGTSWTPVNSGLTDPNPYRIFVSGGNLFVGTRNGVFRSSDKGASWVNLGPTYWLVDSFLSSGSTLFAGSYDILRSTDNGSSWIAAKTGWSNIVVTALAVSGTILLAGNSIDLMPPYTSSHGIYRSTDGGASWFSSGALGDVLALAVSGTTLFAGTTGGMFRSFDGGASWSAVDIETAVASLAVYRSGIFAGTVGGGVFLSTDSGTSWSPVGLSGANVRQFAVSGSELFVAAGGVYRRPLSEMITGVNISPNEIPGEFKLEQNYPNPFNPSTTIRYALPRRAHVTLAVFNVLGQQVANLVDAVEEAGYHDIRFDSSGLASGVYFYRMSAGGYVASKRLILVR
jgi:hypothetical protein